MVKQPNHSLDESSNATPFEDANAVHKQVAYKQMAYKQTVQNPAAQDKIGLRVMVIAESEHQRQAFSDTIEKLGLQLIACLEPEDLIANQEQFTSIAADIWLVDSHYDDTLYQVLEGIPQSLMLVGFDQAPKLNEINLYAKWQRKLKRKIGSMIDLPATAQKSIASKKFRPWEYVILLSGTQDDSGAIKAFMDALPSTLPIAVLLVQDIQSHEVYSLPQHISQNNEWQSQVISLSLNIQAGYCYVLPPNQKVVFDSTGRAIVNTPAKAKEDNIAEIFTVEAETSETTLPIEDDANEDTSQRLNVAQLIDNCSDAFGEQFISVVFQNVVSTVDLNKAKIEENNSQLWVQNSHSNADNMKRENDSFNYQDTKSNITALKGVRWFEVPADLAHHLQKFIQN